MQVGNNQAAPDLLLNLLEVMAASNKPMLDEVIKTTDTYKGYVVQTKKVIDDQAARIAALEAQVRALQGANQQQAVAINEQKNATQAQVVVNGQQEQQITGLKGQVSKLEVEKQQQAAQFQAKFSTTIQGLALPVSGIQQQVHINAYGGVSGKNVLYTLHHPDGSEEKVRRVWRVYATAPASRLPLRNTAVIEQVPANELAGLLSCIANWQKNVGNKAFPNVNIDLCGARLL